MYKILKEKPSFAIFMQIFVFVFSLGLFLSLIVNKLEIHQYLNCYHSGFLDVFFQGVTFLGDGIFAVIISIFIFFFIGKKEGTLLIITFLISALIAQGFKNFVFSDAMRPLFYIRAGELNVETVEGIKMHMNYSFPSGHSTTIFAVCSMLSLFFKSKKMGFLLIILAVLTAYSRIYLSQHFFQDTIAGAFLGVATSSLIFLLLAEKKMFPTNNSSEK